MSSPPPSTTPFDLIGGMPVVRKIVDRFYDLLEQESEFADLRQLHASDLTPMRQSLTGFLAAWLGGPRDWFAEHPGKCMMSAHRDVLITGATARQWAGAMEQAISGSIEDASLGARMAQALSSLAAGMVRA